MKKNIFYILGLSHLLASSLSFADISSTRFHRPLHGGYPGKVSQLELLTQIKAGTEALQVGFKAPTSCTAPTIDPEIKRASAGEKMIRSAIDFCSSIRTQGNPELPMPTEFKVALKDSLTKAKKALSEPKTLAVLSDELKSQLPDLIQGLEKDVAEWQGSKPLTIYQWNLFHLRLVRVFDLYRNPRRTKNYPIPDIALIAHLKSQDATQRYIESDRSREPIYYDGDFNESVPGALFPKALKPSKDLESCPFTYYGNIGSIPFNQAWAENVYPLGVSDHPSFIDGQYGPSLGFLIHDVIHGQSDHERQKSLSGSEIQAFRSFNTQFLQSIRSLSLEDQLKLNFVYFHETHENTHRTFESMDRLASDCLKGKIGHSLDDALASHRSNLLLPKNLRITSGLEMQNYVESIPQEKWNKIAYSSSARGLRFMTDFAEVRDFKPASWDAQGPLQDQIKLWVKDAYQLFGQKWTEFRKSHPQ